MVCKTAYRSSNSLIRRKNIKFEGLSPLSILDYTYFQNPVLVFRIVGVRTIQAEHSTEKGNVICSVKSLCTQQIVVLDVFSASVT